MEENGRKLFELVDWYTDFAQQLASLYKKISDLIQKNFKYNPTKWYVDYGTNQPHIPTYFHMAFKADKFSIEFITNMQKDLLEHNLYENTPSINCFKIYGGDGSFYINNYQELASAENKSIKKEGDYITGIINLKGKEAEFKCYQVPLEMFNGKDADQVIVHEIIEKIRKM